MKKATLLILFLLTAAVSSAQKEKLKGSRNVTTTQKEVGSFQSIEVDDNIEIFLTQGDKNEVAIEADDNLHEAISVSDAGGALRLTVVKEVGSFKKLGVQITYTDDLSMVVLKDDSRMTALTDLRVGNFTIKASGSAKAYATVKANSFTLMANDKAKVELNVTAQNITTELNKNATLKALFSTQKMIFDMYLKSSAVVEGDVNDIKLRMDSSTNFTGKNLTVRNAELNCEGSSNLGLAATGNVTIEASGKSDIILYGDQTKIEIRKFIESSSIRKKPL